MFTKIISWLIVIGLINYTMGCTAQRTIRLSDKSFDTETKIISVTLTDGKEIVFDELGGQYISKTQTINGFQVTAVQTDHTNKKLVAIKTQDIWSVRIAQISTGRTLAVVAIIVFIFSLATWEGPASSGMSLRF